jgi:hypothetical protein
VATKTQIDRQSQRIDELAEKLGMGPRVEYRVALDFTGQSAEEFLAEYPWWGEIGGSHVTLTFGNEHDVSQ